jgi:tetratricopeptide (TPR) repeat protein
MLQRDLEHLLLLPWTCESTSSFLRDFVEVLQFLLAQYCSVWQNPAQPNLVKNLTRTLQGRWKSNLPLNQLGETGTLLLKEVSAMHHARFLLSGHVTAIEHPHVEGELLGVKVQILLFDTATQAWALNHTLDLTYFEPHRNRQNDFAPVTWRLEELMQNISLHLIAFMKPKQATSEMASLCEFHLDTPYDALVQFAAVKNLPTAMKRAEDFQKLAHVFPENALIHLLLGRQLKLNRKYVEATKAFEKALLRPFFPKRMRGHILNELGSCVALSGDRETAIEHWQAAIEADPTHVLAYMNITHAYEELGLEKKAERYLKEVLNYSPSDTRVYHALARLYSCQNMWDKAMAQYQLQLLLEPSDPWCHNNIATCALQLNKPEMAKRHFKHAQVLDADGGEAGQYATLVLTGLEDENHMNDCLSS